MADIDSPEEANTTLVELKSDEIQDKTAYKRRHTESGTVRSPAKRRKALSEVKSFEEDLE